MKWKVYLSGEIHSDWRIRLRKQVEEYQLPVDLLGPVTDHEASDNVGVDILGEEQSDYWKDQKSAKINAVRIQKGLDAADIVIIKFGDKYRQWNAAYDAGYARAMGKPYIVIHPEEFTHALKEVDSGAAAVAENEEQVLEILKYIILKK